MSYRHSNMKKSIFLTLMAIQIVLFVHKLSLYLLCEEPELDILTSFAVWIGIAEEEKQCPSLDFVLWSFFADPMVKLIFVVSVFGSVIPSIVQLYLVSLKEGISYFILRQTGILWQRVMRKVNKFRGRYVDDLIRTNVQYHVFKNAFSQRKEIIIMRKSDQDVSIFKYNKQEKKFRCIMWYPSHLDTF